MVEHTLQGEHFEDEEKRTVRDERLVGEMAWMKARRKEEKWKKRRKKRRPREQGKPNEEEEKESYDAWFGVGG